MNFLLIMSMFVFTFASNKPDLEGEALFKFLTALNDSHKRITDWDYNLVSPCFSWSHVTCTNGNVVSLSLSSNGFSGNISPSITTLQYLVSLDLQNNSLSGNLPDFLNRMSQLQNLNLANNNFKGSIPESWGDLSNLRHLVMRGNNLSGSIPESLVKITGLKEVDLSSNNLTGRIPKELLSTPIYNFTATRLTCGNSLHQPCDSSSSTTVSNHKSKASALIAVTTMGAFSLLLLGAVFVYRFNRAQSFKNDVFVDVTGDNEREISFGQLQRFSFRQLQLATENFSEANMIGQGGFGRVYRGMLMDNTRIAVKRLVDYHSPGGEAAFLREIHLISVAVHKNLLKLIGFCTTPTERILVYPFMQNLSVAYRLRELKAGEKGLDWPTRKKIAFGVAHGLEYLHDHCSPKIIHRDLKAANILLNDEFEPVIGDFGLAKLVDTRLTHVTTQVRGTMGHIAPEYLSTGKTSEKTDVFCYGITLLELVTGQRAIDFSRLDEDEDVLLLDHIKKLVRGKLTEKIVDDKLSSFEQKEVETILQVAMLCTQSSPEDRPAMAQVVSMLEGVGLDEKWAEWERFEEVRNKEFSVMRHKIGWAEDSTHHQEAMQLSQPR